jgi:hypothetical protein
MERFGVIVRPCLSYVGSVSAARCIRAVPTLSKVLNSSFLFIFYGLQYILLSAVSTAMDVVRLFLWNPYIQSKVVPYYTILGYESSR